MVYITASVENNIGDTSSLSLLGDHLADLLSSLNIAAEALEALLGGRSSCKCNALYVVNDLSVNVLRRTENVKTRALCGTGDLRTNTLVTADSALVLVDNFNGTQRQLAEDAQGVISQLKGGK